MFKLNHNSLSLVSNTLWRKKSRALQVLFSQQARKRHIIHEINGNTSNEEEKLSQALVSLAPLQRRKFQNLPRTSFQRPIRNRIFFLNTQWKGTKIPNQTICLKQQHNICYSDQNKRGKIFYQTSDSSQISEFTSGLLV